MKTLSPFDDHHLSLNGSLPQSPDDQPRSVDHKRGQLQRSMTDMPSRGVKKNSKVRYELADKLIPFKFIIPRWLGSVASRLIKYTKEILKNTKEK